MTKARDPERQRIREIYELWFECHGLFPVTAKNLHPAVAGVIDPQDRGRQFIVNYLRRLVGTRAGDFILTAQQGGKSVATTYALRPTYDEA